MINPFDKEEFPFCYSGHQYALDIISNEITANIYIIAACKRYLKDLEENDRFYFEVERAERFLRIIQNFEREGAKCVYRSSYSRGNEAFR